MATTQATGRDQRIKRLCWLLDAMIEHLDSAPPESALGGIAQYEDEAAELIETTGLADEAEIPAELRPVLKRTKLGWVEVGLGQIALVGDSGPRFSTSKRGNTVRVVGLTPARHGVCFHV